MAGFGFLHQNTSKKARKRRRAVNAFAAGNEDGVCAPSCLLQHTHLQQRGSLPPLRTEWLNQNRLNRFQRAVSAGRSKRQSLLWARRSANPDSTVCVAVRVCVCLHMPLLVVQDLPSFIVSAHDDDDP